MARVPDLKPDELSDVQRKVAAEIAAGRGGVVRGPFALWLRNPELAGEASRFGSLLRVGTSVPRRLSELAILITARHWTAQYEWYAHETAARDAGVADDIIEAIRHRRAPAFKAADEAAVHAICTELYQTKAVSPATYETAKAALGQQMLIELVTIATFYAMIAMILVTFEAPLPEGAATPLPA
ncbi:MAG: carboxymuconolactone decarboxylase family protein [Rhodospirillales bacterium]